MSLCPFWYIEHMSALFKFQFLAALPLALVFALTSCSENPIWSADANKTKEDSLFLTALPLYKVEAQSSLVNARGYSWTSWTNTYEPQTLIPAFTPESLSYRYYYGGSEDFFFTLYNGFVTGQYPTANQGSSTALSLDWNGGGDTLGNYIGPYIAAGSVDTFLCSIHLTSPTHPDTVTYTITFLPGTAP